MTPLRWLYSAYLVVFVLTVVTALVSPDNARPGMVVMGVLVSTTGIGMVSNTFGMTDEVARNAGKSKWTPPVYASTVVVRLAGVVLLIGGIAFAAQALLVEDL